MRSFPLKFVGVPLQYNKFRREDIQPIIDKIIKKIPVGRANTSLIEES